jgi:DNA processing protein
LGQAAERFPLTAPGALTEAERLDWLRLWRSDRVGPVTFRELLRRFGSASSALAALPDLARRGGGSLRVVSREQAQAEWADIRAGGATLAAICEADYPPALAALEDAPPLLTLKGNAQLLRRPAVAVVGARNASALGVRFARGLAADLASRGLVVISGMARGIDRAAHEGALEGGTIAVLAGGIDVVYPPENADIHARVAEQGLLMAELPYGVEAKGRDFPRRNRLISGSSLGVVVVEAAPKSGSLITARLALEQGREVFAVPGSPLDPRHRGTNDLIRQGATLVESADDVMRVIGPMLNQPLAAPFPIAPAADATGVSEDGELDRARERVAALLDASPVPVDELLRQTGLNPAALHMVLLELELAGRLARHPGNKVALAHPP